MSRGKWAVVLAVLVVLAAVVAAYAAGKAKPAPAGAKWEYLVVTAKATFSVSSETLGLLNKQVGNTLLFVQQAGILQQSMDELGKQGWELVTVVGTIGGDQEFIFKRRGEAPPPYQLLAPRRPR